MKSIIDLNVICNNIDPTLYTCFSEASSVDKSTVLSDWVISHRSFQIDFYPWVINDSDKWEQVQYWYHDAIFDKDARREFFIRERQQWKFLETVWTNCVIYGWIDYTSDLQNAVYYKFNKKVFNLNRIKMMQGFSKQEKVFRVDRLNILRELFLLNSRCIITNVLFINTDTLICFDPQFIAVYTQDSSVKKMMGRIAVANNLYLF